MAKAEKNKGQYDLFAQPDELDVALDNIPEPLDKLSKEEHDARVFMRVNAMLTISNMSVADIDAWLEKPCAVFGFKTPIQFCMEDKKRAEKWWDTIRNIPRKDHFRKVPKELLT